MSFTTMFHNAEALGIKLEPPESDNDDDEMEGNRMEDSFPDASFEELLTTVKAEAEDNSSNLIINMNGVDGEAPELGERYPCPQCNRTYKNKSHVYRHIRTHSDILSPPLHCSLCSFFTKQKATLQRHIERRHGPNAKPKEEFQRVVVIPTEGPPLPYQCGRCNKSYSHRFALDRHTSMECPKAGDASLSGSNTNLAQTGNDLEQEKEVQEMEVPSESMQPQPIVCEPEMATQDPPSEPDQPPSIVKDQEMEVQNDKEASEDGMVVPADPVSVPINVMASPDDKTRPFRCVLCGKCYKKFPALLRHTKDGCGKEDRLSCEHCHFQTNAKRNFPKHFERKHATLLGLPEAEETRFQCPTCPRSYKHQCGLLQHIRYDCGQSPQFKCPQCPYQAKRKHHIASHVTNNHPKDERTTDYRAMAFIPADCLPSNIMDDPTMRRFQCSVCLKSFKYRADLTRHKEQRCGKNLRFNCPNCPKNYSRQDALDRHIRCECNKEPQFKCEMCSYRASRKFSLQNHVRIKHSQ